MQVVITGKQLNVSDPLRGHVEKQLAAAISKYFEHAIEASVVFSRQGKGKHVRADISVHAARNIQMQGHGEENEAKAAFDSAMARIAKRLRRYKRRLRDHRNAGHETMFAICCRWSLNSPAAAARLTTNILMPFIWPLLAAAMEASYVVA